MNRPVEDPVPEVVLEMWRRFGASDLREARRLTGRSRRTYACIGHRGDSLIVRLSDSESSRTSLEAAVSARCAHEGIPVPTVIHTGIMDARYGLPKGSTFRIDHRPGSKEPALWCADIVAGAFRWKQRGNAWRHLEPQAFVYELEIT